MMPRSPAILTPLDIGEIDDIPFDFGAHMDDSETILSVVITAEADPLAVDAVPVDPAAQDMVSGPAAIGVIDDAGDFVSDPNGKVVLQRFDATQRIARTVYCLRCVASLSSGRRLTAAGHIAVKRL